MSNQSEQIERPAVSARTDVPAAGPAHGQKAGTLADSLARAIAGGRFAPGQRLVEADLTAAYGVGRGLLREAFRKLAAEGLIEIVPNRGALVRRFSRIEALELFEIRTELEALAARRASQRMALPDIRERFEAGIAPIWEPHPRSTDAGYIAENHAFHAAILAASGNSQLAAVSSRLQLALILSQIRFALSARTLESSVSEHRLIATAILDRDPDAAQRTLRLHLYRAADIVRTTPPGAFGQD
ncbi:GntR family transcriptional regulator [Pelagibacterium montanilacus]|uniref:GntR family transcriptional regulator n=1 Tax=Pelagibacterium montanilacus TaxID=2185280 RepID=UPI0013E0DE83|nr:GntR family transcriptional regulator [Pelagibacterium montanilacus]